MTENSKIIVSMIIDELDVTTEHASELYVVAEFLLLDQKNIKKFVDVINRCYDKE